MHSLTINLLGQKVTLATTRGVIRGRLVRIGAIDGRVVELYVKRGRRVLSIPARDIH